MTVKIICGIVIIFSCSYIGVRITGLMRMREKSLTDMLEAVMQIESCISSVRMPLSEIYQKLAEARGKTGEFFEGLMPGESWEKRLNIFTGLTEGDKLVLIGLSEKLGAYEMERQLDEIKYVKDCLSGALSGAKKDIAENGKVYRSLSFFAGVVTAVILV